MKLQLGIAGIAIACGQGCNNPDKPYLGVWHFDYSSVRVKQTHADPRETDPKSHYAGPSVREAMDDAVRNLPNKLDSITLDITADHQISVQDRLHPNRSQSGSWEAYEDHAGVNTVKSVFLPMNYFVLRPSGEGKLLATVDCVNWEVTVELTRSK